MNHSEQAYIHADKAVHHWQQILAGSLSNAQRNYARLELIKAVGQRVRAKIELEREVHDEVGIAA